MKRAGIVTTKNSARKEIVTTSFDKIYAAVKDICKLLDTFNVKECEPEQIKKCVVSLESKTRNIRDSLKDIDNSIVIRNYKQVKIPASITIQDIGEGEPVYKVTLQELLPHRITFNKDNRKLEYDYIRDNVFSGYATGVEEYLLENDIYMFKDKITVLFMNYIPDDGREYPDLDNLDQKPFIDAVVNKRMVPDDSGKWLRYIMDSVVVEGLEKAYTEVYIGHLSEIIKAANYEL